MRVRSGLRFKIEALGLVLGWQVSLRGATFPQINVAKGLEFRGTRVSPFQIAPSLGSF